MGQVRTFNAPRKTVPWFDHQVSRKPRRSRFPSILGRDRLPLKRQEGLPMRRREFIAGIGSAAAWPFAAPAQQPAMPVIGFLSSQSADLDYKNYTVPFLQGLKETGYVEGQNVAIVY